MRDRCLTQRAGARGGARGQWGVLVAPPSTNTLSGKSDGSIAPRF